MALHLRENGMVHWRYRLPIPVAKKIGQQVFSKSLGVQDTQTLLRLREILNLGVGLVIQQIDKDDLSVSETAEVVERFDNWCKDAINGWTHKTEIRKETANGDDVGKIVSQVTKALRANADSNTAYTEALEVFLTGALKAIATQATPPFATISDPERAKLHVGAHGSRETNTARTKVTGFKVSNVIAIYLEEVERAYVPKTILMRRLHFSLFLEQMSDIDISEISRLDIRKYKETLMQMPVYKSRRYPDVPLRQLLSKGVSTRLLAVGTVNSYLATITTFFDWAYSNGYIDANPATRMKIRKKRNPNTEREILSTEELTKIFVEGPVHVGCVDANHRKVPGKTVIRDHFFWAPLIALYSGLRLGEICSLLAREVRQIEGVWCFDITETGHRNHKTPYCARIVPAHPELIRIGLIGYVEKITNDGGDRLWPDLVPDQWGYYSVLISKFWFMYRRSLGITSRRKPFYSFRHNFINEMRRKRVAPDIICELVGHRMGVTAYHRYAKRSEPSVLLEEVSKLNFGIDLSHLYERV